MLPETKFILHGALKHPYEFTVHPINIELPSNFGGLYVYVNYNSNERKLIYAGKSIDIPRRHEEHKHKTTSTDAAIISKSTHIGIAYMIDVSTLEEFETDLLEGNDFELNIHHNQ